MNSEQNNLLLNGDPGQGHQALGRGPEPAPVPGRRQRRGREGASASASPSKQAEPWLGLADALVEECVRRRLCICFGKQVVGGSDDAQWKLENHCQRRWGFEHLRQVIGRETLSPLFLGNLGEGCSNLGS